MKDKTKFMVLIALFLSSFVPSISSYAAAAPAAESSLADAQANRSLLDRAGDPMELTGEDLTLQFGLESRYRLEYRDDFNLANQLYDDGAVNLFRNRLSADLKYKPEGKKSSARLFTEGLAAQSFSGNGLNKSSLFVNQIDLRQLFLELSVPVEDIPVSLKVGRQELAYGDERLVGPLLWTNTARVFDAVKLIANPWEWLQMDSFYSHVVRTEPKLADKTMWDDHFFGLYAGFKKIKDHVIDTFVLGRYNEDASVVGERNGRRGHLHHYTLGNRLKGKKGRIDYGTEYALQFGRRAHDSVQAWSFHQDLGYTFADWKGTPRLYGEYNHASGDRNPSDGVFSTFDNLFPTNHNKYGLIDFLSLKNMNDIMLGTSIKPHQKMLAAAEFHWFFLDAKESAWFNASGGVFRAANANADTQLGEELDLYTTYAFNKHFSLLAGYSHFFAGPFAQDTGGNDDANFLYTQLIFKI